MAEFKPRAIQARESFVNEFASIRRDIEALRNEHRAGATTVNGDFTVTGGGSIRVNGTGGIEVSDGGGITVRDGGRLEADGGQLVSRYRVTRAASVWIGTADSRDYDRNGVLVQHPDSADLFDASVNEDGSLSWVRAGTIDRPLDQYYTQANDIHQHSQGRAYLGSSSSNVQIYTQSTTSSPVNAHIDPATNVVSRSTSSRRYKQDEEEYTIDPNIVLKMQGKTWRDKSDVIKDPDTDRRYVGVIAEDLDEIGMGQFVIYDEHGPESVMYDRLVVAVIPVLQMLFKRVTELEVKLDDVRTQTP
jgi:hypothetical protein